ncbi:MAG TPA: hypothetical protein VKG05_17430 [Steroidobacteraceae bacterium]|nr:hypothetical protein [Steroidobacteraceae bacterium]
MNLEYKSSMASRLLRYTTLVAAAAFLSACVEPVRTVAVPPPPPPPRLFIYPANGQSPDQLARDHYECHTWAVQQTGIDPSRPGAVPYERVVVGPAPGSGTATGLVGGAIVGSILAGPRDSGIGALFGAATGAIIGSSADQQAQAQSQQAQQQINQQQAVDRANANAYRRAISTCLIGRGYTVS